MRIAFVCVQEAQMVVKFVGMPGESEWPTSGGGPIGIIEKVCDDLDQSFSARKERYKAVGILFLRPETKLARLEIIPNLRWYNQRSGQFLKVYVAGFEAGWTPEKTVTQKSIRKAFNLVSFDAARASFSAVTKWAYSGDADLLIVTAKYVFIDQHITQVALDFKSAISIDLADIQKQEGISSISNFLESLFQFLEGSDHENVTAAFSDREGLKIAGAAIEDWFYSLLPKAVSRQAKKAKRFAIRDISK
jgi:hypothetical protein